MLGRIQIRRPSKTASPALCLFTNFDHFGNLVGGGSFGMENNDFSIDFPGSGLYLVCRCPFHGYIGEEMLDDGWRLTECAISCIFSMTISMKNDLGRETHTSRHVPCFVFFRWLYRWKSDLGRETHTSRHTRECAVSTAIARKITLPEDPGKTVDVHFDIFWWSHRRKGSKMITSMFPWL